MEAYNPDIVGVSTIMSTTRAIAKDLIEYFEVLGIRNKCKIIVGGASITARAGLSLKWF